MSTEALFYWGTVVTLFVFFAFILTLRELFEAYMEQRDAQSDREDDASSGAA